MLLCISDCSPQYPLYCVADTHTHTHTLGQLVCTIASLPDTDSHTAHCPCWEVHQSLSCSAALKSGHKTAKTQSGMCVFFPRGIFTELSFWKTLYLPSASFTCHLLNTHISQPTHTPADTRHLSECNVLSSTGGFIRSFCNVAKWHQTILRLKYEVTELWQFPHKRLLISLKGQM